MPPASPCPDDELVERFVEASADPGEMERVRAHLAECSACRRLISTLVKETIPSVPMPADEGPLLRGMQIGRYVILDVLGAGRMGIVHAAYDPKLDRKIALKLLRPEAGGREQQHLRERLLREAQAMARLAHPNVVAIHDVGESADRVYIAMELVDGRSVRSWLAERPRRWREILEVYLQAARGLAAAHRAGLVHRDFKPDNVLIARDGRVLVSDFGLAHMGGAEPHDAFPGELPAAAMSLTQTGMLLGTPAYMPPEQLAGGAVDARADVYAFAVAAWEGLFGQHPFPTDSMAHLHEAALAGRVRAPARSPVPNRIRHALLRALRPDAGERWADLQPLVDAFTADPRRKLARVAAAIAVLAALLVAAAAVRQVVETRRQAAQARTRAELARRLGREVERMELGMRMERLLPLHDAGRAERRIGERLQGMRALLAGTSADGPVHDAIGRGLATLGDHRGARVELEQALREGTADAELHFTLGYALIRLHAEAVEQARAMGGPTWLELRKAALDREYLPAARRHLELSRGASLAPPRLLEALLAYQSGDLASAFAHARAAAQEQPLFYEAELLVGMILRSRGQAAADAGDVAGADVLLAAAVESMERAASVARSDASIYDALAGTWLLRLIGRRTGPFANRVWPLAAGLLAADRAIAAAPDRAAGYTRRAHLYSEAAAAGNPGGSETVRHSVDACIASAQQALARDAADVLALDTLGNCQSSRARLVAEAGGDPSPALDAAARALTQAQRLAPGFPWAANDLCSIDIARAEDRRQTGRDPIEPAREAVSACELALRLDPSYGFPYVNLPYAFALLLGGEAALGSWDAAAEETGRGYARAALAIPSIEPANVRLNLLDLLVTKLEAGRDAAATASEIASEISQVEKLMRPELMGSEYELLLLEARAQTAVLRGDPQAARPLIDRCLDVEPRRLKCGLLAARIDLAGGRAERALDRAQRLAAWFPRSARPWLAQAEALRALGRVAPGIEACGRALELAPALGAAYGLRGRLELTRAEPGRALADLERAVALAPALLPILDADRRAALRDATAGRR